LPTILMINGWRIFFYSNENSEPIHVHCIKGEMECKYWLRSETFEISEAFTYNMNSGEKREIRKIIYGHFEYIENEWNEYQRRQENG